MAHPSAHCEGLRLHKLPLHQTPVSACFADRKVIPKRIEKRIVFGLALIMAFSSPALAQTVIKKKRLLPYEYGRVLIDNYSEKNGLAPVVFEHWLHRAKFTCRLCHVDIGFAMKAGATGIKAADNMRGYYCGACHNGKMVSEERTVFESCSKKMSAEDRNRCGRCHSLGKTVKTDYDFDRFAKAFPKERFGNGLDWQKAEEMGTIQPLDFLEGISIKRLPLQADDSTLTPNAEMPEIVFSHQKHTIWNGCELCHPDIFGSVRKGGIRYPMDDIFGGKYCGVCHGAVAFPLLDCQRCHSKPVQP